MHHTESVCFCETFTSLHDVRDGFVWRERATTLDETLQIGPVDELHHDVGLALRQAIDIEHSRHVLALEACSGACLALKPSERFHTCRALFANELHRDHLIKAE